MYFTWSPLIHCCSLNILPLSLSFISSCSYLHKHKFLSCHPSSNIHQWFVIAPRRTSKILNMDYELFKLYHSYWPLSLLFLHSPTYCLWYSHLGLLSTVLCSFTSPFIFQTTMRLRCRNKFLWRHDQNGTGIIIIKRKLASYTSYHMDTYKCFKPVVKLIWIRQYANSQETNRAR